MGVILKNSSGSAGAEKMVIMTSASGGKLRLFPGTNQSVIATINDGGIVTSYRSLDSGDTFNALPDSFPALSSGNNVENVSVSFNNRYYYIGDPSIIEDTKWIARSDNFAESFTYDVSRGPYTGTTYGSVSSSRDGKYILGASGSFIDGGDVALSQDFGETWSKPFAGDKWFKVFVDSTGENMLIGGWQLTPKYSSNFGSSWSNFSQPMITLGSSMISGNGNYKVVYEQYESGTGVGARLYVSTDWINWTQHNLTARLSTGAISNDGKYMLVPSSDGYNTPWNTINLSKDYGQTFEQINLGNVQRFSDSAMSADGKYMIVISGYSGGGYTYKSVDYGETWEQIDISDIPAGNYKQVKMSKSGRYSYIIGTGGIFYSKDYMATWDQHFPGTVGNAIFINF